MLAERQQLVKRNLCATVTEIWTNWLLMKRKETNNNRARHKPKFKVILIRVMEKMVLLLEEILLQLKIQLDPKLGQNRI
jgi:hypothetical protein